MAKRTEKEMVEEKVCVERLGKAINCIRQGKCAINCFVSMLNFGLFM